MCGQDGRIINEKIKAISEEIRKLVLTFDLRFSDSSPEESVRYVTFRKELNKLKRVGRIVNEESALRYTLFEKLPLNHPIAELWLESQTDLLSSTYLVLGGYYRQAVSCLRNWLELTLVGVYYDKYYRGATSRYNQWKAGKRKSPKWRDLMDSLFSRPHIRMADGLIGLRNKIEKQYGRLSLFVHSRGIDVYNMQKGRDNVPRFLKQPFDIWLKNLNQTFEVTSSVLFAAYPNELRKMSTGDFKRLLSLLSSNVQKDIKRILQVSPDT